jgi:hypothetical protein
LVPLELLERLLAAETGKIDTKDAGLPTIGRPFDDCRFAAALLDPPADLVVVNRGLRSALCSCPSRLCHIASYL